MRKGEAEACWRVRERTLRRTEDLGRSRCPGSRARGQAGGDAREWEMRWPRGAGLHSATCSAGTWQTVWTVSGWLTGELGRTEDPGYTQV